jgi:cell division septum initiation protein DivIVA
VHPTTWLLDASSPDDVARATFSIVRKGGFDPVEVQGFARSVSAEIIRLQAQVDDLSRALRAAEAKASERVTEAMAAGYLGEETSRMLQASREAAESLRIQAEERAARLTVDTEDETQRMLAEAKAASDGLRQEADHYARGRRNEADAYAETTRRHADEYAAQRDTASRADAEALRRQAVAEAERLVREALDHKAAILRELVRRRDLACAQVRSILDGRDLVVEALDQVRLAAAEIVGGIQELSASPADFVSLDPSIEGPGVDRGAALAVRRVRQTHVTDAEVVGRELPAAGPAKATRIYDEEEDVVTAV